MDNETKAAEMYTYDTADIESITCLMCNHVINDRFNMETLNYYSLNCFKCDEDLFLWKRYDGTVFITAEDGEKRIDYKEEINE